ncbi:MAG: nucleoid occlusion protein, partial [Anaerotignum sp.]|nr:nucleoid occlusion protein [Anaerotignum sp.]
DYGLTQEELAVKLSKSQSSIANKLRVLKLEDSVKKLLLEHNFTERHARALLRLPDEESRLVVLSQMIAEEMNVKKTEELVEATLEIMRPRPAEKGEQKEKRYVRARDFRIFTNTIKQRVEVIRRSGVDVDYEDKQEENSCEIVIRIRRNADIA